MTTVVFSVSANVLQIDTNSQLLFMTCLTLVTIVLLLAGAVNVI